MSEYNGNSGEGQYGAVFSATGTFYVVPKINGIFQWNTPIEATFLEINGQKISDPYYTENGIGGGQQLPLYEVSTYNPDLIDENGLVNLSPTITGSTSGEAAIADNVTNLLIVPVGFNIQTFVSLAQSLSSELSLGDYINEPSFFAYVISQIYSDFKTGGPYDLQRSGQDGVGDVPAGDFEGAFTDAASWIYAFTLALTGIPEAIAIAGAAGQNLINGRSDFWNDPSGIGPWELTNFNSGYAFAQNYEAGVNGNALTYNSFAGTYPNSAGNLTQAISDLIGQVLIGQSKRRAEKRSVFRHLYGRSPMPDAVMALSGEAHAASYKPSATHF